MKKPRLIRAWLQDLDSEVQKMAEANMTHQNVLSRMDNEEESLADTLLHAFNWGRTPEGFTFWDLKFEEIVKLHGY